MAQLIKYPHMGTKIAFQVLDIRKVNFEVWSLEIPCRWNFQWVAWYKSRALPNSDIYLTIFANVRQIGYAGLWKRLSTQLLKKFSSSLFETLTLVAKMKTLVLPTSAAQHKYLSRPHLHGFWYGMHVLLYICQKKQKTTLGASISIMYKSPRMKRLHRWLSTRLR